MAQYTRTGFSASISSKRSESWGKGMSTAPGRCASWYSESWRTSRRVKSSSECFATYSRASFGLIDLAGVRNCIHFMPTPFFQDFLRHSSAEFENVQTLTAPDYIWVPCVPPKKGYRY